MVTNVVGAATRPLLGVAPLVPAGGVDTLLVAFGLLAGDRPGLCLEIVGGGPLRRGLRALTTDLGLDDVVRFRGPLPAPAVRAAVQRCAALVLPHRAPCGRETPPPALRHALTGARPVVATSAGVPPLLLRHGETGLLVDPDDPAALAVALAGLVDDPEHAAGLGTAGSRVAAALPPGPSGGRLRQAWQRIAG
jgi:glycosyltransferase involved in cell wall biosynthesis